MPPVRLLVALVAAALVAASAVRAAGAEEPSPAAPPAPAPAGEAARKVVFLAGPASHGYGTHEHYAGSRLLADLLGRGVPGTRTEVHRGWPKDPKVLDDASAIVVDCDGGSLLMQHLDEFDRLAKKGIGLACLHYTVDVPKGRPGDLLRGWIGGAFETHWSVNPTWEADFRTLPDHPIARGVKPFRINDEWYYHMRFVEGMKGVAPILTAVPPDATRRQPDGAYSGNPEVRARLGMPEHVAWAYERPGGGRGFGFTGLHWHWNLAHDGFRRILLNAILWVAGGEVPPGGVPSPTPTLDEIRAHLDSPPPKDGQPERLRQMIEAFNRPPAGAK